MEEEEEGVAVEDESIAVDVGVGVAGGEVVVNEEVVEGVGSDAGDVSPP
jgi:hypothetical protein